MSLSSTINLGLQQTVPNDLTFATIKRHPANFNNKLVAHVDGSISGNRLIEHDDRTIELVPKTPAEVFGEKVLIGRNGTSFL